MNVQLTLNDSFNIAEKKERIKEVQQKTKEATKTIEELIAEINTDKFNEKELALFAIAKQALLDGSTGRMKDGKLSKSEMIELGKKISFKKEAKERKERIKKVLENKPENYHIVTDMYGLNQFLYQLKEECLLQREQWKNRWERLGVKSLIAVDTEGTGVDSYVDLSIGLSIWLPILDQGYYIPYGHVSGIDSIGNISIPSEYQHKDTDKQLKRSLVLDVIKPYMQNRKEGKSFHMGAPRYDLHMAINDGYQIHGCVWDSLNASYLLYEHEESYGLKPLTRKYGKYFGIEGDIFTFDDLFGNCSPAPFNIELVGIYAIHDVYYGWRLTEWQYNTMSKTNRLLDCYSLIDSKLPEKDVVLQRNGFNIDFDKLKELDNEFTPRLEKAQQELFKSYNIDKSFIEKMNKKINAKKIADWLVEQKERIKKHDAKIEKYKQEIAEIEKQGKTHLKKYQQAKDKLQNAIDKKPVTAKTENAPFEINEFTFTNNNHLAYLIYDVLGITDITPRIKRGKTRAVSKDILEKYFEQEEALKPLAEVSALEKLLNTYVRKIPEALEVDGKLHSMFDATGTSTGRYASKGYSGRPVSLYQDLIEKFGGVED